MAMLRPDARVTGADPAKALVLAGVNGTDLVRLCDRFLDELGFAGLQNFPTVGLIGGMFRPSLEETGMGYEKGVELIRATSQADLRTTPYVLPEADARAMIEAGADIIVCHLGLTTGSSIGPETPTSLDDCVARSNEWSQAAAEVREMLELCRGGPIADHDEVDYVLANRMLPRLLRRQQHGTPTGREGVDQPHRRDHTMRPKESSV